MEAGFAVALDCVSSEEQAIRQQLVGLFADVCALRERSLSWHANRLLLLHKEEAQRRSIVLLRSDWDARLRVMLRKAELAVGLRMRNQLSTRGKYFGRWGWVCLSRLPTREGLGPQLLVRCTVVGRLGLSPLDELAVAARCRRRFFRLWARFRWVRFAVDALCLEEEAKRARIQGQESSERQRRILASGSSVR